MRTRSRTYGVYKVRGGRSLQTTPDYLKTTWNITSEPYLEAFSKIGAAAAAVENTLYRSYETMYDEAHGMGRVNPVTHEKTIYGNGEFDYVTSLGTGKYAQWTFSKCNAVTPPTVSSLVLLENTAYDVYQRQCRAWRDLQPEFKNEQGFSGVNTLLELRDFKRLPSDILRLSRNIVSAARNVFKHESHKTLAQLQLFNEYSFKPTVADAANLSLIVGRCAQHLRRFNAQGRMWNTRHYKEDIPAIILQGGTTWPEFQRKGGTYAASLRCRYQQAADNALGDFVTYHGLTLTPAQIWEAIPFSFLVDQVFTVGKTLERLSRTAVTNVSYGTFLESYKMETVNVKCFKSSGSVRYFVGGCSNFGIDIEPYHAVSYARRTSYARYASMPPALGGMPIPQFKCPTVRNLVNDLALLRSGVGWKANPRSMFNGPNG